jgi:hypothetical protein
MRYLSWLAWLATAAAASAQTVWTVNPPTDLTQFFATIAPGDIVLLGPGSYVPFTLQYDGVAAWRASAVVGGVVR